MEEPPEGCSKSKLGEGCDKLYLDTTQETRILREVQSEKEAFVRLSPEDLQRGQGVRAWHTGVLTRSYPGQGRARVILVEAT